jgi:GntR family transcriptional regulator
MLEINPTDAVPIWKQIEDEIRRLLAAGTLVPGGPVPSVRDLARDLRVNPATVSKAYQHLMVAGLLEVRRGDGTYVAEVPPTMKKSERRDALAAAATRYVSIAFTMGADREEALSEFEAACERLDGNSRRKP